MRALAGDEGIDPCFGGLGDFSARSPSHQSNFSADCRPTWRKVHLSSNGPLEIFSQQVAFNLQIDLESDLQETAPLLCKAECVAEQGIIPVLRMSVQGKMSTVNCDIVRHGKLQLAIERSSKAL